MWICGDMKLCGPACPKWKACDHERRVAEKFYNDDGLDLLRERLYEQVIIDCGSRSARKKAEARNYIQSPDFVTMTGFDGEEIVKIMKRAGKW